MSIRYYLFLLAGCITTIVSLGSFFVDEIIFSKNLQKTREGMFSLLRDIYEQKRESEELFLASLLAKKLAHVNTTLEVVSKFDPLTEWFVPTQEHKAKGTWNNAANLMQQEDWIAFLQNTGESSLLSLIVPEKGPFFEMEAIPIKEGLAWIYILGSPSYEKPFLGIKVPVKTTEIGLEEKGSFLEDALLPTVYILYEPERLKKLFFSLEKKDHSFISDQAPFPGGIEVDEPLFLSHLSDALSFIQNPSLQVPPDRKTKFPLVPKKEKEKTFEEKLTEGVEERENYSNELFLIWQASILRELGIFGREGKEENLPEAMGFSSESLGKKQAFFLNPVMGYSKPLFEDAAFFAANPPKLEKDRVSSGSGILRSPHGNRAFLVNTVKLALQLGDKKETSLLTLGFDLAPLLENLVLSSQRYGAIFSKGEVFVNLAPEAKGAIASDLLTPLFGSCLNAKMGFIDIAGVIYHFSRLQPDPNVDLHFFLFAPKEEEFSFIYAFQSKMQEILNKNGLDRKLLEVFTILILWILLLDLSKKITNPILALSSALKQVGKGNCEMIQMPRVSFKKGNEIKQLFDSFRDMLEGLKEKEKITAILHKVVSEEIAKEILKGEVKLGGEERVVTMLFADIRGFSALTQNMPPQEVIGFLNKCMTKLSDAVEGNKGVIDKYMGDGLMALFGAPIRYEQSALDAVISGLKMIDTLKEWNLERIKKNLSPIYVGIGIHTGSVFAGNMGALNRLNYTVIGSSVNLASRLCSAAGPEDLLITEDTYGEACVKNNVEVEDKGLISFKGFNEKKRVFKVVRLKGKQTGKFLIKDE